MTAERTEDAALSGVLKVIVDGHVRRVPVLKLKHSREWKASLGTIAAGFQVDDDLGVTIARVANLAADTALDLVCAYDRTGILGGRDEVEEAATDVELFTALEAMIRVTFPFENHVRSAVEAFGPQLRQLGMALMANVVTRLSQDSSTPTPSVTGDSTPTPLTNGSPMSSSSSSGRMTSEDLMPMPVSAGT